MTIYEFTRTIEMVDATPTGIEVLTVRADRADIAALLQVMTNQMASAAPMNAVFAVDVSKLASTCAACGASFTSNRPFWPERCDACLAGDWRPVGVGERALSTEQLDALPTGARVTAGGFHDHRRSERVEWIKLDVPWRRRWQSPAGELIDGKPGVSATWLAANRDPRLLAAPAPHWGGHHD